MDKTTMPEPVAYQDDDESCWELTSHPELMTPLITTTQAEAYADARVREALEQAAAAVEDHSKEGRSFVPDSLWGNLTREAAARIRALIPSTPARPESEQ